MSVVSPAPLLSVVIVSYNVRDLLENCLHSLASALRGVSHEVFVVDNQSGDGSVEMVRQRFPDVILIANDANLGFAKANNLALRRAAGRFLLLLNPDTLVQEDTIHTMLRFFDARPDAGMAGCKILKPDGKFELACRRSFPSPWVSFTKLSGLSRVFPRSRWFARYNLTYRSEDESYEVDAISGSFMMLRRAVYDAIGGLDEDFFMYGEDLDWCFRTQKAGWKIFYVHETQIVHYRGESTRRSAIDAKAVFYEAMQRFAKKNLGLPGWYFGLVSFGIRVRRTLAGMLHIARSPVFADVTTALAAVLVAEYVRMGGLSRLPAYAYPAVYLAPTFVMLFSLFAAGTYTQRAYPVIRSAIGVMVGFLLLSSLTFFYKEYAFSRYIVLLSSALAMIAVPGRRVLARIASPHRRLNLFAGRKTLLIGVGAQTQDVLAKLRRVDAIPYDVVGIVDIGRRHLGERVGDVPVLGSVDMIGKLVVEHEITDVIFLQDLLNYSDILAIIAKPTARPVHFRIVQKSMESIVGKASIDQLTGVPLVDVEYNLTRTANRAVKRMFDITISAVGMVFFFPFIRGKRTKPGSFAAFVRGLPSVLRGAKSIVGYPEDRGPAAGALYMGKPGLTGLIQLRHDTVDDDEAAMLTLHYARNQSVLLDVEILLRALAHYTSGGADASSR